MIDIIIAIVPSATLLVNIVYDTSKYGIVNNM